MKFLLFFLFVAMPIAEIAVLIQVGGYFGFFPTLGFIILTAVIGTALIRQQGLRTLMEAQQATREGRVPIDSVINGLFLLVAAVLLLTPGFITDAFGFLLLWQPVRMTIAKTVWAWFSKHAEIHVVHPGQGEHPFDPTDHDPRSRPGEVIEGEVIAPDENKSSEKEARLDKKGPVRKSPWTK